MQIDMKKFIDSRIDDFINDLESLVNIDSSSDNIAGIVAVAEWLRRRLEAIGFSTRLKKLGDRGVPCLQAGNRSEDRPFDILFLGHMDTVFPTGEVEKRPFAADGDRATGPGVCDMKGGLLVALHVLEALHHNGVLDQLSIGVCFNGDEEVGSGSSRQWVEAHARSSRRVFVFEPCRPEHRFVLNRKGGGGYRLIARGRASHAGVEPEKGANAAVEIAHQVLAVHRFDEQSDDGVSANVTVMHSGEKTNIIPDEARASVDVRVGRKSQIEAVETFFRSLPDNTHVPGVVLFVDGGVGRPPMEADEKTMQLWALIEAQAGKMGLNISFISTGGCSDGNFSSSLDIPTIDGMGPIGGNAHRTDEYVDLSSVVPQIELIASVCQTIAQGSH
jgi:glutamate carboxypeptidase